MIQTLAQLERHAQDADAAPTVNLLSVIAPYMGVFFAAFFVAIILTPIMRWAATRNGVVDWPDLKRKNHVQPVAYLGGVAIFLGWLVGVTLCYFIAPQPNGDGAITASLINFPMSIILGAAAITLTGLFDDVYGISPRVKVGGQLFGAAALANEAVGLQLIESSIQLMGLPEMPGWVVYLLGTAVIAVFVLGGCNATNLLDGLDGLAAGVTAIAALGFLVIAGIIVLRTLDSPGDASAWDPIRIVMCLAILGAVLGFLPYNFNPATIFMGDAGSLLLGYLSVATILMFAGTSNGIVIVTAALIVFALPIADTALAIFRRKMQGKPIFSPDCHHIHHLLRRSGMSVKQATLTLYAFSGFFAVTGASLVWAEVRWRYILAVFVVLYGFIIVTAYKYGQLQQLQQEQRAQQADADDASTIAPPSAGRNGHAHPNGSDKPSDASKMPAGPPV
ncbi:glycosyltransferase family 4 protein [Phycisphaerales bacterium AB-hyl4]|uniref:Glycosyltransferase family 4 protein n=1 Tax=Natronomicrosphaera hydrolytica TaxID=3242702 RepID=A0ABV4TZI4_9BACT